MSLLRKKQSVKILNTGAELGEATIEEELRFLSESERFTGKIVRSQSVKDKVVIYGAQAVNALVGPMHTRPTNDFDVYSHTPKKHSIHLERSIDNHVKADVSHVEEVTFKGPDGKLGRMYRVKLKNFDTVADYNKMPSSVKFIVKNGVRYENLRSAEKKYNSMIAQGETKRLINANADLDRIHLHKFNRGLF
jgi:hypothetical protein